MTKKSVRKVEFGQKYQNRSVQKSENGFCAEKSITYPHRKTDFSPIPEIGFLTYE